MKNISAPPECLLPIMWIEVLMVSLPVVMAFLPVWDCSTIFSATMAAERFRKAAAGIFLVASPSTLVNESLVRYVI
jgi:hypothetical protein